MQFALQPPHWYLMQQASTTVVAGRCNEPISVDRSIRPYYRVRYPTEAFRAPSFTFAPERFRLSFLQDAAALQRTGSDPLAATGYQFTLARRYASPAQAAALQATLDRLQALNLIGWARRGGTLVVTVAGDAGNVIAHGV